MLGILKKDWYFYIGYLVMVPLQMLYYHTTRMQLDTTVVFMMTGWMFIMVLGSVFGVEMTEIKNRGYFFLATLPVSAREIVTAKLAAVFAMLVIYVSVTWFSFARLEVPAEYLVLSRKWLLLNWAFALVMTGSVYWFTFRFGFEKAVYLQGILFLFAFLVPILLNELVIRDHLTEASGLYRFFSSIDNAAIIAVGVALFLVFWFVSVRTLERKAVA
jgi:hypothetical protein